MISTISRTAPVRARMGAGGGAAEEAAPEARLGEAPPVGVRAGVVGATTGSWRKGELTAGAPRRCTNSSPSARTTIRTANPARYRTKTIGRGSLYPIRFEDEALTWQWSFWGMTEIERPLLTALFHRALLPEDRRDAKLADESEHQLGRPLMVLDAAVANTPYLLGEHFTVADLNVAGVLSWARPARIDLGHVPKMADWLKRCAERPAARAARELQR